MSTRTLSVISSVLTVVFLILFAVLFLFVQMVALNGASERQGFTAMGVSLLCQGIGIILAAFLAARFTNLAVTKWNWNQAAAVIVAVIAGTLAGGALSVVSIIVAIPIAGIR